MRSIWSPALALGIAVVVCAVGCSDDDDGPYGNSPCRFDPAFCYGGPGAFCDTSSECQGGFCCTEQSNCGGGMCTFSCDRDADCPADMACSHSMCFFMCSSNADCAEGQHCEHGSTVCEWP